MNRDSSQRCILSFPQQRKLSKKAAEEIGLIDFDNGDYEMIGHFFGKYDDLQSYIPSIDNINELNLLAYKLKGFTEEQSDDFMALLTDSGYVTVKDLINKAYYLESGFYEIWRGVTDLDELGHRFVQEEAPDLPEEIFENIDYEDVGYAVEANDHGEFTPSGYIRNYNEVFDEVYDGTNLHELLAEEQQGQKISDTQGDWLNEQNALLKTTIDGLTATAVEKACVLGADAMGDINALRKTVADLICFWSLDERHLEEFDQAVQTVMGDTVQQNGMQMN